MTNTVLKKLRALALLFLFPGLAGLLASASLDTFYFQNSPQMADMPTGHILPHEIHGLTVYLTPDQDHKLRLWEYGSVGIFLVGMLLGVVYLERWAAMRAPMDSDYAYRSERPAMTEAVKSQPPTRPRPWDAPHARGR